MEIDLTSALTMWQELIAMIVAAWAMPVANAAQIKPWHIRLPFTLPHNVLAITLFPLVIYGKTDDERYACLKLHERVHVKQARKLGPLAFYTAYLFELLALRKRGRDHSLEKPAYEVSDACFEEA